jgi:hypothetical protein
MTPLLGELTTRALSACCAGSALVVGGMIGLLSLRASPEKRGVIFHRGTNIPFSRMSLAAFASLMIVFGSSLLTLGLIGHFPILALPVLLCLAIIFAASARRDPDKDA